jgi:prephenate dehydrogenase
MAPFARVTVVGLGAMGGSLARALAGEGRSVTGWSPDAAERRRALEAGVVRRAPDTLAEAVRESDLVVLAAPLGATCDLVADRALRSPGCVLTDVASLKVPVRDAVRRAGLSARWAGSHPMAGTEASGFEASRTDLYRDARVWLVAEPEAGDLGDRLHSFWSGLGARPAFIDAEEHDRLMARVSHLPQLASNALARVLADAGVSPSSLGPGGREVTRLAGSNPAIWRDILAHAGPDLGSALRALAVEAETLARLVDEGDTAALEDRMRHTRSWRAQS